MRDKKLIQNSGQ